MTSITAIITAGGIGRRMGSSIPKQYLSLAGIPVLIHTINAFLQVPAINNIILVVPAEHIPETHDILKKHKKQNCCKVIAGGIRRQDSVKAGMEATCGADYVAVHDGVRPLISRETIERTISGAQKYGAAIAAIPVKDTLKSVTADSISNTVDREGLWQAQTPQTVQTNLLKKAYKIAEKDYFEGTDEASLLEHAGIPVTVVEGSEKNIKITRPEDLVVADALITEGEMKSPAQIKIGHGYDAHRLVSDRPLVLGGVTIPHTKGLLGHSDADVLTHALCDAMLGAVGAGDIGRHFPDSDTQYKGIESIKLLKRVTEILTTKGYRLGNADITVIAQKPKLAPFLAEMQQNLAKACETEHSAINIKATTTEEMGFTGRQEGIACHAVVVIET